MRYWLWLLLITPLLAQKPDCKLLHQWHAQAPTADSATAPLLWQQIWQCTYKMTTMDSATWRAHLDAAVYLGGTSQRSGKPEITLTYLQSAARKPLRTDTLNEAYATLLHDYGTALYQLGRPAEALAPLHRALKLKMTVKGSEWHLTVAKTFNNLGLAYLAQKDYARAEYVMMRAGGILMRVRGERDIEVAQVTLGVGAAQLGMKKPAEAELTYKAALHIMDGYTPTPYSLTIIMRAARGMAQAQIDQSKPKDAMKVLSLLLQDLEKLPMAPPAEKVEVYRLVAATFEEQDLYEQAVDSYGKALEIVQQMGQHSARLHYDKGRCHLLLIQYDQAQKEFDTCLSLKPDEQLKIETLKALYTLYDAKEDSKNAYKLKQQLKKLGVEVEE